MSYIIAGLGNPGKEYKETRHNTGRIVLEYFRKKNDFPDWRADKKTRALVSEGKMGKEKVLLLMPETFMNNSGKSLAPLVTSKKKAEQLVVIYDDLDLPVGALKVSFDRGSGGHKGIESIARSIKTKGFVRIRVGISPKTASGKTQKPKGEQKVIEFILKNFKDSELEMFKKLSKKANEAISTIITEGHLVAMNRFN
ncbi:MAG: aminoacyl-tRNA hydrolase [Candidatus Yonathbacteria bacterium]|nr:aminoacyl-tRNA hydrolase [Candidatus Yonathbacteria bacterium]